MFSFDHPENTKGFLIFSGGSKKHIGKKRVQLFMKNLPFQNQLW